ncbi:AIPR family protein [Mesosutterella sp. OilRF-GAM-744-9]|uniref:AIPR family protein n=1 Tax=Mesosutterella porci TaxID=2915351 RepID=A0ABS9MS61_9BURK|nr:AIPR family protein [Mesosutterella sp. oilRF-744-WT-GAM-9]MCG5031468.1 AIPR family protein [Mesosutterella sp. oilRF-744-WT-GAM-9]
MSEEALLQQYFSDLQTEVRNIAAQMGLNPTFAQVESAFTEQAAGLMTEMGLIASRPEVSTVEGLFGNSKLRITACALSDDRDRLDLFVSLYESTDRIFELSLEEAKKAAWQALQFLKHCADGSLSKKMPESGVAASLVSLIEFNWKSLDQVKLWVLTNGLAGSTRFKPQEIEGRLVGLEIIDLRRLSRMAFEGEKGESVNIDFSQRCGEPLPCVFYSDETLPYDTALCLFPGEILRSLYENYDARLLEANVRSYLSLQSKVNRGMYATLRDHPENFLAFNNGIVVVAEKVQIARTSSGTTGIKVLAGMKIVNGGQTTATLFFARRRDRGIDLSKIRIPAKILIPKSADALAGESFVTDVSRFANTQNNVRASDLSSSSPFHVGLEHIARTTWCPDGATQWFYERATGSYRTMLAKESSPAARRRMKAAVPPSNRITKLDLAKYMNAWLGHPDLVCQSPQKNFALFMKGLEEQTDIENLQITAGTWKDIVSVAIFYRSSYRLAKSAYPGEAAVIAAYSVAVAAEKLGRRLRLRSIWEAQGLSEQLKAQIAGWQKEINGILRLSALGKPLSEWARDPDCWRFVKESVERQPAEGIPEMSPAAAQEPAAGPAPKPEAEPVPNAAPAQPEG